MREGFLIGGGLIIVGLLLEAIVGPVDWGTFRWPVNGVVMGLFLMLIGAMHLLQKRVYVFQFMGTSKAAVPALVYVVVLTVVMGLVPQKSLTPGPSSMGEGSFWINYMLNFWPFVLTYVYIDVILGLAVIRQVKTWAANHFSLSTFRFSLLSHLGLFLAMTAATLGNADMQRLKMIVVRGEAEWRAMTPQLQVVEMPIAIELREFIMEVYDNGKPKRYASDVQILTRTGKSIHAIVEVNKPVKVEGWKIYQYSYDTQKGPMSQTSILELVCDPWLPVVYVGIYLMLAGAVCFMLRSIPWAGGWRRAREHPRRALSIAVLIGAVFFCVHHFMPILHSDTLVPALQSPWFRPHIIAYMLAYTLMGSAAVMALYQLVRDRALSSSPLTVSSPRGGREGVGSLVFVGLSLITIGMLFGALWAKEAWGHYWSWDPKETWAAITWFSYLVFVHYRQIPAHKPKLALWLLLISFALLQMCWWGIKFLPSAQETSVHVYGT